MTMRKIISNGRDLAPGSIMVVEDDGMSRTLLRHILEMDGHRVIECSDGWQAINALDSELPDLVMLDVVMEGINGREVCRRLKNNPATASIPVLLVSGFCRREDQLEGIEAGANDFISKPVDFKDVRLRVRNNLYTKRLHDHIRNTNEQLKELEKQRETLIHMIIHDLRSPLSGLSGYLELLEYAEENNFSSEGKKFLESARYLAEFIMQMIQSVFDVTLLDNGRQIPVQAEKVDLVKLIKDTLRLLGPKMNRQEVVFDPPEDSLFAWCDPNVTARIFLNLIVNAIEFTPSGGRVVIELEGGDRELIATVVDDGPGIAREDHEKIFRKSTILEDKKYTKAGSAGLGLVFCKMAAEAQGGRIGLDSEKGRGSRFRVTLPSYRSS